MSVKSKSMMLAASLGAISASLGPTTAAYDTSSLGGGPVAKRKVRNNWTQKQKASNIALQKRRKANKAARKAKQKQRRK